MAAKKRFDQAKLEVARLGMAEAETGVDPAKAQHHMSQKDFLAAASAVVGKPALAGTAALAHQGAASFDQMHTAIARTGAAGEIAASQTKGLSGAVSQLKTQWSNTGQVLYTAAAPGLEKVTRLLTAGLGAATPHIASGLDYLLRTTWARHHPDRGLTLHWATAQ
ncbi:hypothetical protein DMH15_26150, partial [Streptomyces sp. WAC 06725]|uniref:hypothetical protein n=1 Tax=Streptomyces sp. WAC 06725 TaxID=2203209 RepID=UPI0010045C14